MQENLQPLKLTNSLEQKLEVPKRGLLVSNTPVVFQETPEEKFKFQGLIFPIVSSKIMLSLRDSTHLVQNNSGVIYMKHIIHNRGKPKMTKRRSYQYVCIYIYSKRVIRYARS